VAKAGYTISGSPQTVYIYYDATSPVYEISLKDAGTVLSGTHTFTSATYGYTTAPSLTVTVANTGNQPTGALTAALTGDGPSSFNISTTSISSIAVGGTDTFTVSPKPGLAAGTYTSTVTVTGGNGITAGFDVSFKVNKAAGATVDAPTVSGTPTSSITVNAVTAPANGQTVEYAISTTTTAPSDGWQSGTTFGSLTVNATYYVFARSKENDNYNAGAASVSAPITTVNSVKLESVTANGDTTQSTTQLTLTFDQAITGLAASDITLTGTGGLSNVTKGTLSGINPYYLPITGIKSTGELTVSVSKSGYAITDSSKTVAINYVPEALISSIEYATLTEAINEAANGSLLNPTEIVILRNITANQNGSNTYAYNIPAGKNIKLNVAAGNTYTITAAAGSFSLFSVTDAGSSLTLGSASSSDGTLILSGGNLASASDRRGVKISNGTLVLYDITINGFNCSGNGGGVYVSGGTFTMEGGKISNNTASSSTSNGGGVYVSTSGTFTMSGGEISSNTASGSYSNGGGVYVDGGTFNMSNGKISSNTSAIGGGVFIYSGIFNMNSGEISTNIASSNGGGIHVYSYGTFTMSGGKVYGINDPTKTNTANGSAPNGVSIFVNGGTAKYSGAYGNNNITTTNNTLPEQSVGLTISFAQISDGAPIITGPTLSKSGTLTSTPPSKTTISIDGTGYTNIEWEITGTGFTITGSAPSFTLDATDSRYNQVGDHHLTLTLFKDGVPYNKTITFTIVE